MTDRPLNPSPKRLCEANPCGKPATWLRIIRKSNQVPSHYIFLCQEHYNQFTASNQELPKGA
jgi:hypothetical protein